MRFTRAISKNDYKRVGPNGNGSEYWMIDVVNAVSRVKIKSTSLQNYAHANRIGTLVDQILLKRMHVSKIIILTSYTGQMSLVGQRIEVMVQANGRTWSYYPSYQISSVDAFQGEENEFTFVDLVVVRQKSTQKASSYDADDGSERYLKCSRRVTAHVKSANRLFCALTRGKSYVDVVCHLSALLSTTKNSQPRANAVIGAMAKDFLDCG